MQIKLDKKSYGDTSSQGDWVRFPHITMIVEGGKITSALDSDEELRWLEGKGQFYVGTDPIKIAKYAVVE